MADDSQEVADIIDGLGEAPAPLEVYNATRDYDTRYLASAGAAAAAAGGGGMFAGADEANAGNTPFTATAGRLVEANDSNGGVVVNLPEDPQPGSIVGIELPTAPDVGVTIATTDATQINGEDTVVLTEQYAALVVVYAEGIGDAWTILSRESAGGGSQPGLLVKDFLFTEVATAGVYTAPTLTLPANSYLIDIQWWLDNDTGLWAADTAVLDVVDSAIGSIVSAQDVQVGTPFSAVSAVQTVDLSQPYVYPNLTSGAVDPVDSTVTTTVTTTIESPPVVPSAVMVVRLVYVSAPTPAPAVFA